MKAKIKEISPGTFKINTEDRWLGTISEDNKVLKFWPSANEPINTDEAKEVVRWMDLISIYLKSNHQRISIDVYNQIPFCTEKDCPYMGSCAQHETAADSSSNGGFAPFLFEMNNSTYCGTKNTGKASNLGYGIVRPIEIERS